MSTADVDAYLAAAPEPHRSTLTSMRATIAALLPTAQLAEDVKGYRTAKGSVRFTSDEPLPAVLIRRLVDARLVEIDGVDP